MRKLRKNNIELEYGGVKLWLLCIFNLILDFKQQQLK